MEQNIVNLLSFELIFMIENIMNVAKYNFIVQYQCGISYFNLNNPL